ncbi:MAG: hypothetical protein QNJ98_05195 [Planctomycetota bacterium]|nr:hypothetical protein [Planctomycetota bacterium]
MRKQIIGSFIGFVLAISFLAACGGGGGGSIASTVQQALQVLFDNTASGMTASNVQEAIDELDGRLDTTETDVGDLGTRMGAAETDITALSGRATALETRATDIETDVTAIETDVTDLDDRVTTLENNTAADLSYDNTASGLTATDVEAAIDELAEASGGYVFTRWGSQSAPTGTTLVYAGIAVGPADGEGIFLMKDSDAGGTTTEGGFLKFIGTETSSSRMPPGITANRRIVGCVCVSTKPVTTIYGSHTAPTGWSVLYKGYLMADGGQPIVVDTDSFDASAGAAGTESFRTYTTQRLEATHDTTKYPRNTHIKAAVIQKN